MSTDPLVPAKSVVVIARDLNDNQEHVYPHTIVLKRQDRVVWHTNPRHGEHAEHGTVTVSFPDVSPFESTLTVSSTIGGSTQELVVAANARKGSYRYTVSIVTDKGSRRYDPEVIIEEAIPADPAARAAATPRAGGAGGGA